MRMACLIQRFENFKISDHMIKIKRVFTFCLTVTLFMPLSIKGQTTDCSSGYDQALLLYNRGMADSALRVLKPCLETKRILNSTSRQTSGRIFRLAALSSIMTENPDDAEKYAKQMLQYLPDYKNSENEGDLMEFRLILDKLSAQPLWRIGIMAGTNYPFTDLLKKYSYYATDGSTFILQNNIGYQFGMTGERFLKKNISLEAGAALAQYKFSYGVKTLSDQHVNYNQNIYMVEIPVIAKYYFLNGAFRPYIEGGISGRFLLNPIEKSHAYGKYWFTNSSNSDKVLATFISDFEYMNFGLGGGLTYDLKGFSVRMDIRYNQSMKNNLLSRFDNINGYGDISAEEKFSYTDDLNVISFNNISISLSLVYNLKYKVF
jgi:Outer membrane protein beta-barrel domain